MSEDKIFRVGAASHGKSTHMVSAMVATLNKFIMDNGLNGIEIIVLEHTETLKLKSQLEKCKEQRDEKTNDLYFRVEDANRETERLDAELDLIK